MVRVRDQKVTDHTIGGTAWRKAPGGVWQRWDGSSWVTSNRSLPRHHPPDACPKGHVNMWARNIHDERYCRACRAKTFNPDAPCRRGHPPSSRHYDRHNKGFCVDCRREVDRKRVRVRQ